MLFLLTADGFRRDPAKSTRNPSGGTPTLLFNWVIEWDCFMAKGDPVVTVRDFLRFAGVMS